MVLLRKTSPDITKQVDEDVKNQSKLKFKQLGETGASSASGHVRHVAIFSMSNKIWGWETYLEITCDKFIYMSTQWLHC